MAQKLEQALLPPPKDSVGARILKKMGWRMGQGIGPRLTYRQRKLQDALHATGSGLGEDEDEAEASKHTYAPRDTPLLLPQRKDNTHGLGYSPGMGLHESVTGRKMGAEGSGPRISGTSQY
jgi:G patch domain-containing protein 1